VNVTWYVTSASSDSKEWVISNRPW